MAEILLYVGKREPEARCRICGEPRKEHTLVSQGLECPTKSSLVDAEPAPKDGTGPAIWDLVISDLSRRWQRSESPRRLAIFALMIKDAQARDKFGLEKYGKRLRNGDGRDALVDGYQEVLDLAVYLRKEIEGKPHDPKETDELQLMYDDTLRLWFKLRNFICRRDGK